MGTGFEFTILSKKYEALGTDNSPLFVDNYLSKYPNTNVKVLDAVDINLANKFDCIYSNKVLQNLTKDDFIKSLSKQHEHLNTNGIIFMTLWHGRHDEMLLMDDTLRITYYEENDIKELTNDLFEITKLERYTELEENDSILIVLKMK